MKPIKEEIEDIMPKYLENRASESESLKLMDALIESQELRTRMNVMASGLNRMLKRRRL
jgi:hypothetical protein